MLVPKLVTTLKGYTRDQFTRRPHGRRHRRHRRAPARHRVRDRQRRHSGPRALHRDHRRIPHLRARRLARADRRPDRRVRRHRLRHRPEVRRRWPHRRDDHGRRVPRHARCSRELGSAIKFIPHPGGHRVHERDRGHHLLEPGQGLPRPSDGCRAGGFLEKWQRSRDTSARSTRTRWRYRRWPSRSSWCGRGSTDGSRGRSSRCSRRRPSSTCSTCRSRPSASRFGAISASLPHLSSRTSSFAELELVGPRSRSRSSARSSRCSRRSSPTA